MIFWFSEHYFLLILLRCYILCELLLSLALLSPSVQFSLMREGAFTFLSFSFWGGGIHSQHAEVDVPRPGIKPVLQCDLCHSCSNAESLTHCAEWELFFFFFFLFGKIHKTLPVFSLLSDWKRRKRWVVIWTNFPNDWPLLPPIENYSTRGSSGHLPVVPPPTLMSIKII